MNIFVAKLDYSITSQDLEDLFTQYGSIDSAKVIMDRETGRSKGFGFVEMPNEDEAYAAIEDLNGSEVKEREIVVKKAEPRKNNNRGGRGGYGGGGNRGGYGGGGYGGGGYGGGGYNNRY